MIKFLAMLALIVTATGCASSGVTTRLDSLEAEVNRIKATADQALQTARDAQSAASGAASQSDVNAARQLAERAMDTANDASERLTRMQDECCGGK